MPRPQVLIEDWLPAREIGIESVRAPDGTGITVSYWRDDDAVARWREHPDHLETQARGRTEWYEWYELRVARVGRARSWRSAEPA